MKVDPATVSRFLEQAATEQLSTDLLKKGYKVERDVPFGSARADLVARGRDGSLIIFEVKVPSPENASSWARQATTLRKEARALGGRFKLVLVRRPRPADIEIAGLEEAIRQELIENPPKKLEALSHETTIEDVSGIDITSLSLHDEITEVEGEGVVQVPLYSSDGEAFSDENFPFQFRAKLDRSNRIISFTCEVDVSAWCEIQEDRQPGNKAPKTSPPPEHEVDF
jgi:hypothetical protein